MRDPSKIAIRLRLDPTNPGQFFACCGLLELADRAGGGAQGWFENNGQSFCVVPLCPEIGPELDARSLLRELQLCKLVNTRMTQVEIDRRSLLARKKYGEEEANEKQVLDELWNEARHEPLYLHRPFNLRLDWFTDDRAGGSALKTWAGQQSVTDLAFGLKSAIGQVTWDGPETEWLFRQSPCDGLPFNFDSALGALGSDRDVGFSFDPLKRIQVRVRPLLELLAFIGLQRFRPVKQGRENLFHFSLWEDPLSPILASGAASGLLESARLTTLQFRLLYRTSYLKSFLPAIPLGERA